MNAGIQEVHAADPLAGAWSKLAAHLDERSRALADEVRNYPTPIARCDEQLTKLIEQRGRAQDALRRLREAKPDTGREEDWRRALSAFLAKPPAAGDDEVELALRARLAALIGKLQREN